MTMQADRTLSAELGDWLRMTGGDEPPRRTSRFRPSQAGKCSRQIAYEALGTPPDMSLSDETAVAFATGDLLHSLIQHFLGERYGCEPEVEGCFPLTDGETVYGHADGVIRDGAGEDLRSTVVEIKTMRSYPWEMAVSGVRGWAPEGPKPDHLVQASIYAHMLGAEEVLLVYIRKEDGAVASWLTPPVDVFPELARWRAIRADIEEGFLPPREVPGHGEVATPPARGSKGPPWQCRYCPWQPSCVAAGSGRVRVGDA